MLTPMHFLIVCPLIFLAGLVDSIAGGGGLISLPAYLLTGLPAHMCLGTNKLSSFMGTLLTTVRYARAGYIVPWLCLLPVPASLLGAALGSSAASMLDEGIFRIIILIVLPLTAFYLLRRKDAFPEDDAPLPRGKQVFLCTVSAFVCGLYDGFYGPGTGTFLILLMTRFAGLGVRKANGLAKAINLASNVSAVTVWLSKGMVILPLGIAAGLFSLLGNYIGSGVFRKKGSSVCKPIILLVLAIFFIRTALQIAGIA